jgi:hypothetical protein
MRLHRFLRIARWRGSPPLAVVTKKFSWNVLLNSNLTVVTADTPGAESSTNTGIILMNPSDTLNIPIAEYR